MYCSVLGNYEKVEHSLCYPWDSDAYSTYDTLKDGTLACNLNDNCVGVVDIACEGNTFIACGKYFLTLGQEIYSSCIYKKVESHCK